MEFTGRIIKALEPRGGVSNRTGNPWKMQDFVIEETMGQFPKRMVFNVFGEENLTRFNIQEGQELTVSFDINAREYNGRWYTSIRGWKAEAASAPTPGQTVTPAAAAAAPAPQTAGTPVPPAANPVDMGFAATAEETDDLPF